MGITHGHRDLPRCQADARAVAMSVPKCVGGVDARAGAVRV